jgi:hypothetical protein
MFTLTTAEANPVSHAILRTHANGVLAGELWNGPSNATAENVTRQVAAVSAADVEVVSAFYGTGNQFPSVTTKVRDLLQSGAPLFTVTDQTFDVNPDNRHRELLIRYQFRGKRGAVRVGKGENLSMALLANAAESGMDLARYSADPPDWLAEAQPDPPLDAGVSGAGVGQGPRKELGIMALLRTVADLEALRPQDDPTPTQAIPLVRQALAQAQLNIRYTFPPPSMKPMKPRPDSSINGLRNALRNLSEARQHLGAANAGADPESMARALAAIDQAMELIQAKMPGRSTPVGIRR